MPKYRDSDTDVLLTRSNTKEQPSTNHKLVNLDQIHELFHDLPMEIVMYDTSGRYKFVNKQYLPDTEKRALLLDKDDEYYFELQGINPESAFKRKEFFQQVLKEKRIVRFTEKLHDTKKDRTLYYKRSFKPVFHPNKKDEISYIYFFGSNLNTAILGQKELRYLAYHDKLTGLKNRAAFYEQIDQIKNEFERNNTEKSTALLFCDLDNFKMVNDTLGHSFGDLILEEVASRLKLCLRKSDYVYRFGGDEFTVIIKNIKEEFEAGKIAEKFIKYVCKPYIIEGHKITYLTSSVGIVLFPRDGKDLKSLIKNADTAMYSAKKRGKNNYQFFSLAMNEYAVKRLKIEKSLTEVVNKNKYQDQFEILYQPIVEKKLKGDYQIIGCEALLRWMNPELGAVKPETFIPIAEETNLISDIGEWIFYTACRDFKKVKEKIHQNLYLSINFSAKQLRSASVIRKLEDILKSTGFDASALQLELTETSYLDDHIDVVENIAMLERMGVKLALDDFGVGFASLSYLHKVPAQTIKIDKSFIRYISTSPKHKELVRSIIMLGKNLKKEIVAEGVEQVEDLYLLEAHNCFKYQGFLFSEPISLSAIETLLKRESLMTTVIYNIAE